MGLVDFQLPTKFNGEVEPESDINQAGHASAHDGIFGRRVTFATEITAQSRRHSLSPCSLPGRDSGFIGSRVEETEARINRKYRNSLRSL
jgi:hypothetical protein